MAEFKIGDAVELKTGGPKMTVERLDSNNSVYCQWFDGEHKLRNGSFQAETLKAC